LEWGLFLSAAAAADAIGTQHCRVTDFKFYQPDYYTGRIIPWIQKQSWCRCNNTLPPPQTPLGLCYSANTISLRAQSINTLLDDHEN
jgi:hypothetical protein